MRLSIRTGAALLLLCSAAAALTFAQDTIRTGFVVITLVSGNFAGLIANETLINGTDRGVIQAGVSPATLLTNAALPVNIGPESLGTTAIAFANPSLSVGEVNLLLTGAEGGVLLNRTIPIGPQGQFSRFLNELALDASLLTARQVGLLTVTSTIPVATVALDFRSGAFSTVPVSSLSFPLPVPVQTVPITGEVFATSAFATSTAAVTSGLPLTPTLPGTAVITTGGSVFTPITGSTFTSAGTVNVSPAFVPPTLGVIAPGVIAGPVFPEFANTPGFTSAGTPPNFGIGIAPTVIIETVRTPAVVSAITTPATDVVIGGANAIIFPQIASGGGWSSEILIANTSAGDQIVRVDIFTSDGRLARSITDLRIPSQGVRFISTDQTGGAIF